MSYSKRQKKMVRIVGIATIALLILGLFAPLLYAPQL